MHAKIIKSCTKVLQSGRFVAYYWRKKVVTVKDNAHNKHGTICASSVIMQVTYEHKKKK